MRTYQVADQTIKLRHLDDTESSELERLARNYDQPLDICPTCGGRTELVDGVTEFRSRSYRCEGEEYECDCRTQMALRRHYILARIPDQYQILDWNKDYRGPGDVKEAVQAYIDNWKSYKRYGMGLAFAGEQMGTGKTFGATHVAKDLIKRGQRVRFVEFSEIISAYQFDDFKRFDKMIRETPYLVLDELKPPHSERQKVFFAEQLEGLIRHRTNHNLPTIITTNLVEHELDGDYPRVYSLLDAKQITIDMNGMDARRNYVGVQNLELAANQEVRPIT